jgi:TRAP-type C4-dicarboxylate transport system permease small subunit
MLVFLRRASHFFACAGAALALVVGLLTTASVLGRAFFKAPISGDVELTQMGIAFALSLCLPWCQLHGANIFVDFFTQRLRKRTQRWLDALGCLCLVAMYLLLAWRTSVGALSVREAGETSMIISLPMWWAYAGLAPGLALAGVIALVQAFLHAGNQPLDSLQGERA